MGTCSREPLCPEAGGPSVQDTWGGCSFPRAQRHQDSMCKKHPQPLTPPWDHPPATSLINSLLPFQVSACFQQPHFLHLTRYVCLGKGWEKLQRLALGRVLGPPGQGLGRVLRLRHNYLGRELMPLPMWSQKTLYIYPKGPHHPGQGKTSIFFFFFLSLMLRIESMLNTVFKTKR